MSENIKNSVVVAYRCPECNKTILGLIGVFTLMGDRMVLKCSECGKSSTAITKTHDSKLRFDYPCLLCGKNHNSIIPLTAILSRDLITIPCPLVGFDSLFLGKEDNVTKAIIDSNQAIETYYSKITEEDLQENKGDDETVDQVLVSQIITTLEDMELNGKIHCNCEKGKYSLTIKDDYVDLRCLKCNKHLKIYCTFGNIFAYDLLWRDEVYLEDRTEDDEEEDDDA